MTKHEKMFVKYLIDYIDCLLSVCNNELNKIVDHVNLELTTMQISNRDAQGRSLRVTGPPRMNIDALGNVLKQAHAYADNKVEAWSVGRFFDNLFDLGR